MNMVNQIHRDFSGLWRCRHCGLGFKNRAAAESHVRHNHAAKG